MPDKNIPAVELPPTQSAGITTSDPGQWVANTGQTFVNAAGRVFNTVHDFTGWVANRVPQRLWDQIAQALIDNNQRMIHQAMYVLQGIVGQNLIMPAMQLIANNPNRNPYGWYRGGRLRLLGN